MCVKKKIEQLVFLQLAFQLAHALISLTLCHAIKKNALAYKNDLVFRKITWEKKNHMLTFHLLPKKLKSKWIMYFQHAAQHNMMIDYHLNVMRKWNSCVHILCTKYPFYFSDGKNNYHVNKYIHNQKTARFHLCVWKS